MFCFFVLKFLLFCLINGLCFALSWDTFLPNYLDHILGNYCFFRAERGNANKNSKCFLVELGGLREEGKTSGFFAARGKNGYKYFGYWSKLYSIFRATFCRVNANLKCFLVDLGGRQKEQKILHLSRRDTELLANFSVSVHPPVLCALGKVCWN